MTYNEVFTRHTAVQNVPLTMEGRALPAKTQASVVLKRVYYGNLVDGFEKDMQKAVEDFKTEGFDERLMKYREAKDKDGNHTDEAFEQELEELNAKYAEARNQKAVEEVSAKPRLLTEGELADIIEVVGVTGDMEIMVAGKTEVMPKERFISMLAAVMVEQ